MSRSARVYVLSLLGAVLAGALLMSAMERYAGEVSRGRAEVVEAQLGSASRAVGMIPEHDPDLKPQDRQAVEQLLGLVHGQPALGLRMKEISAQLLGRPYLGHSLIGSPREAERFVVRMDGFDCMTFLETVLALGRAGDVEDFLRQLRQIRYEGGVISYQARLHYMSDWNESNIRRGSLIDLTGDVGPMAQVKTLDMVAGLRPRRIVLRYFPRRHVRGIGRWLEDGDLIYFVSGRSGLDVFHVGLVFREGERVLLRHASLRQKKVIDQELDDFVRTNRMLGFILARPREVRTVG